MHTHLNIFWMYNMRLKNKWVYLKLIGNDDMHPLRDVVIQLILWTPSKAKQSQRYQMQYEYALSVLKRYFAFLLVILYDKYQIGHFLLMILEFYSWQLTNNHTN